MWTEQPTTDWNDPLAAARPTFPGYSHKDVLGVSSVTLPTTPQLTTHTVAQHLNILIGGMWQINNYMIILQLDPSRSNHSTISVLSLPERLTVEWSNVSVMADAEHPAGGAFTFQVTAAFSHSGNYTLQSTEAATTAFQKIKVVSTWSLMETTCKTRRDRTSADSVTSFFSRVWFGNIAWNWKGRFCRDVKMKSEDKDKATEW